MSHETSQDETGKKIRFSLLLGSLVIAVVIGPLLEETTIGSLIEAIFFTFVFVAAVLVNWRDRVSFSVAGIVAFVGLALHWSSYVVPGEAITISRLVSTFLFLGLTAALLMRSILTKYQQTPDAVLGAICIYLLLGLMWAEGYVALTHFETAPFAIQGESVVFGDSRPSLATLLYFSFVTMSTLGYGDITPQTDLARTLAWTQSVVGQFYLAILVARLVSVLPRQEQSSAELEEQ
ncbi:hypothetical protein GC197_04190 [bacterium]|nr:hypothetical protein [bacterium]